MARLKRNRVYQFVQLMKFKSANRRKTNYQCPIRDYYGPFKTLYSTTGARRDANCPRCGSLERHRLQKIVLDKLSASHTLSNMKLLRVAPESYFIPYFQKRAEQYVSMDLNMDRVSVKADILRLPFENAVFDVVFASHVLEHIQNDRGALSEIKRVLTDRGIAILPVPIVAEKTIEYPEPNPLEAGHVRAPGPDYFERFNEFFSRVELYSSEDVSPEYQPFIFEKREHWPTDHLPWRKPMPGEKHIDFVPVCYA